ncbi:MAG: hypothetical protein ACLRM8_03115 [Alistipes sp.]
MMKKFALWSLALLLTFAAACSDYDDTDLWNSVNDIKNASKRSKPPSPNSTPTFRPCRR